MINQTYKISAPIHRVWEALTNPEVILKWGGTTNPKDCGMNAKEGTEWKLWGGDIWGKNMYIDKGPNKYILEQEWYTKEWEKPSIVIFTLETSSKNTTTLHLKHKNLPPTETKEIAAGWQEYYIGPLQRLVEESKAKP